MVEWVSTNTSIRRKRHERTYRVSNENYNSNPAREGTSTEPAQRAFGKSEVQAYGIRLV